MRSFHREVPIRHAVEPLVAVTAAIAGATALTILSALVADGQVGAAERRVFDWINDLPNWLEAPAWLLQQPGVLLFPVVVRAGLSWVTQRQRIFWAFLVIAPAKLIIERIVTDCSPMTIARADLTGGEAVLVRANPLGSLSLRLSRLPRRPVRAWMKGRRLVPKSRQSSRGRGR